MNDEREKQKKTSRIRLLRSIAAVVVALTLIIGLTRAWFINRNNIATLVQIAPPSTIVIGGPHGNALTSIDLSYTDNDKDPNNKVTIRRVISVKSDSKQHQLEIAHTTNMKGLTFQLYKAMEVSDGNSSQGNQSIAEGGYIYTYTPKAVDGKYINREEITTDNDQSYKYATNAKHHENYGDYNNVQAHAEPLYWLSNELDADKENDSAENSGTAESQESQYLTYYVLEISWTETTKETDMFYLMARNV